MSHSIGMGESPFLSHLLYTQVLDDKRSEEREMGMFLARSWYDVADNVLLYLDLSGKALQEMERNPDDAYRVLYVGITRTKENLVLKMPEDQQRGRSI